MKPLLIVKTGRTFPELAARRGDYEDWIVAGLGLFASNVVVVDVAAGAPLPDRASLSGVVVTGSSSMVSDREPWSEATAGWLAAAAQEGLPLLGICYGHQLLAHGLGGRVGPNPRGREIGTVRVRLASDAVHDDRLLGPLPEELIVQVTHRETVLELPSEAVALARNAMDDHQAFRVGARAWGVQFHPEFDAEVSVAYIRARREALLEEGLDPEALLDEVRDADHGRRILRQFVGIIEESRDSVDTVSNHS